MGYITATISVELDKINILDLQCFYIKPSDIN